MHYWRAEWGYQALFSCCSSTKAGVAILFNNNFSFQAPVVQTLDSAIHWINHYPLDNSIGFASVYPLDSDLSGGQRYPSFEQLGPDLKDLSYIDPKGRFIISDVSINGKCITLANVYAPNEDDPNFFI